LGGGFGLAKILAGAFAATRAGAGAALGAPRLTWKATTAKASSASAASHKAVAGDGMRIPSAPFFRPHKAAPRLDAAADESR
jgi:hypothetical protein